MACDPLPATVTQLPRKRTFSESSANPPALEALNANPVPLEAGTATPASLEAETPIVVLEASEGAEPLPVLPTDTLPPSLDVMGTSKCELAALLHCLLWVGDYQVLRAHPILDTPCSSYTTL